MFLSMKAFCKLANLVANLETTSTNQLLYTGISSSTVYHNGWLPRGLLHECPLHVLQLCIYSAYL